MTSRPAVRPADSDPPPNEGAALLREVEALRAALVEREGPSEEALDAVHPAFRASARNLLHYLALRRRDLRPLQRRLARRGLSSLGRSEAHVLATVDAVLGALRATSAPPSAAGFEEGPRLLAAHTAAVFGPPPEGRGPRVMVTLPSEAADDPALVRRLLDRGMDCARVNCAHDDADAWARMAGHVRAAAAEAGRPCRVLMDLAGPKLRTGPLAPGPAVVKVKPQRDPLGAVMAPARVWLGAEGAPPPGPASAALPVPAAWLATLAAGDRLDLRDGRGKRRSWTVAGLAAGGAWAEARRTAYVVPGTVLDRRGADGPGGRVGALPAVEVPLVLEVGDQLLLTPNLEPGRPAVRDASGRVAEPARIGCTLTEVFRDVRPGEPIWFDDGTLGGVVERADADGLGVRVTRARAGGRKLRGDKGINLPETALRLAALTAKDRADLPVVAAHADLVGLSFANGPADVEALHAALAEHAAPDRAPAVVVKVETRRAFAALPEILLAAMRAPACAVMIARGDLAVEVGFVRLAEVQEEVLWLCEAAHVPVVWATQVFESLAKTGLPSRAEVTDAAMAHRAEAVMLNKGPHVEDAVGALDDVLRRMGAHQTKKYAELRALDVARGPGESG
jgi:pyruvate kinase